MNNQLLLSCIIVNFNTYNLTSRAVIKISQSLIKNGYDNKSEIIIIDNASDDDSSKLLKSDFKNIILIANKKNVGFAGANNQGLKIARGKYILLLNSDTEVFPDSIPLMIKKLDSEKNISVLGCRLLNKNSTLQPSMGYFPTISRVFFWMTFIDDIYGLNFFIKPYHCIHSDFYRQTREVDWVSGACMMVRSDILKYAGLLDENIFMYGEEIEWCLRIKKNGGRIFYYPDAEIIHLKGSSSYEGEVAGIIEEFESLMYIYQKHFPHVKSIFLKAFLIYGALLRIILFGIIKLNPKRIFLYAKAIKVAGR